MFSSIIVGGQKCFPKFDIKRTFQAPKQFKMVFSSLFRVCSGPTLSQNVFIIQWIKWVAQMCSSKMYVKSSFQAPNWFKIFCSGLFRVCSSPSEFLRTCLCIQGLKWVGQMFFTKFDIKKSWKAPNRFKMFCSEFVPPKPIFSERVRVFKDCSGLARCPLPDLTIKIVAWH